MYKYVFVYVYMYVKEAKPLNWFFFVCDPFERDRIGDELQVLHGKQTTSSNLSMKYLQISIYPTSLLACHQL